MVKRGRLRWDAGAVRGLRRHLAVTQEELAAELGVRQQTVSEWETGAYQPRGASERVLTMVAEQAGFVWDVGDAGGETREAGGGTAPADHDRPEAGSSKLDGGARGGARDAGAADDERGHPGDGGG
ncbi:MAG TPA: helix-turn-helix domain-containing protein [Thermomicrobiales bacterium]|nr:helix-turn-helix domain-containing protein [Thermomicrobiales bacterium]